MIPLAEAQAYVLDRVPPQPETTVALSDALGLVVTSDVMATEDVPGWDNTARRPLNGMVFHRWSSA